MLGLHTRRNARGDGSGFTLIEVTVALAILAYGILAMASAQLTSLSVGTLTLWVTGGCSGRIRVAR